jgi:MFS transporter, DHA1 family, multidrug resistance protein
MRALVTDRTVASIIALALVINFGTGMVLPVLPLYARSFGVGYREAGLLVASFYLARLVFDLAAGLVLDRIGVAWSAAAGLMVLALGAALTGLSPTFALAVISWAAAGAGAAVVWAAMYNGLIRSVPKARMARALSLFYGAFNGGIVAGGFTGGLIATRLGVGAPLLFLAVVAVSLAGLMRALLQNGTDAAVPSTARDTASTDGSRPSSRPLPAISLFRIPGFLAAVVSLLANLWLFGAVFNTLVPLFARDILGLRPFGIGVLYAVSLAGEFLAYWPAGRWADTRGRRFVLIPSFAAIGVICLLLGWATSVVPFALLLVLLGFGSAFSGVPPTAILADVVPANRSASGVAIFRFGGDVGFSLGPLIAGLTAASIGFKAAFAVAGIPSIIALVIVARGRETLVREA